MKFHISRQTIYLAITAFVLLLIVFIFSFVALIPAGKGYRIDRIEKKKHEMELRQYQSWHDETYQQLKELQGKHKRAIMAFDNRFDTERFVRIYKHHFEELSLAKLERQNDEGEFSLYEVNASSKIDSPQSFYSFIDAVNKGEWIISVNFPIHFERQDDLIRSSFTMKVYGLSEKTEENNRSTHSNAEPDTLR